MFYLNMALMIIITWAVLLTVYIAGQSCVIHQFYKDSPIISITETEDLINKPGFPCSTIGTLLVFGANIVTFTLVFTAAISPPISHRLDFVSIGLPIRVNFLGSSLFVCNAVWGLLALLFNPDYTPVFQPMKKQFLLATHGPYDVVRHPRYAGEIWLNIVLFMFTGMWIPLLGALGWIAIYYQAREEENRLTALAGEPYRKYRQHTGMFFPILTGGS